MALGYCHRMPQILFFFLAPHWTVLSADAAKLVHIGSIMQCQSKHAHPPSLVKHFFFFSQQSDGISTNTRTIVSIKLMMTSSRVYWWC